MRPHEAVIPLIWSLLGLASCRGQEDWDTLAADNEPRTYDGTGECISSSNSNPRFRSAGRVDGANICFVCLWVRVRARAVRWSAQATGSFILLYSVALCAVEVLGGCGDQSPTLSASNFARVDDGCYTATRWLKERRFAAAM